MLIAIIFYLLFQAVHNHRRNRTVQLPTVEQTVFSFGRKLAAVHRVTFSVSTTVMSARSPTASVPDPIPRMRAGLALISLDSFTMSIMSVSTRLVYASENAVSNPTVPNGA